MEEQFVPYKLALKLKELDFNELCFMCYHTKDVKVYNIKEGWLDTRELRFGNNFNDSKNFIKDICSAPLWQQVFDWFRESKDLLSYISTHLDAIGEDSSLEESYGYKIMFNKDEWKCEVWEDKSMYETYQEARENCLEKLIEILEKK